MKKILTFLAVALIISSCNMPQPKTITIALSKASDNYINWLKNADSSIIIIDMKGMNPDSAIKLLATCDGLVLTGGEDVYPGIYGKESDTARCEFNLERDTLEARLFRAAVKKKMPVLGICRGMQLINIMKGGTLVIDIPTDKKSDIVHRNDSVQAYHLVNVNKDSKLFAFCKTETGLVTSSHHQAIEKLGDGLKITAYSEDMLPEAIEWKEPEAKGFMIGVQWHPERMKYEENLSTPLAKSFLQATIFFKATH
jgi:putative glutamine amidotransferase